MADSGWHTKKAEARRLARTYAALQLRSQDCPEWMFEERRINPADDRASTEFMDELDRIAARIERTIPAAKSDSST